MRINGAIMLVASERAARYDLQAFGSWNREHAFWPSRTSHSQPHRASVKTCSRLTRHSDKYTIRSLRARRIFSEGSTIPLNVFETTLTFTPAFLANALWLPARFTSERSNRSTSWRLSNRAECPIENFMRSDSNNGRRGSESECGDIWHCSKFGLPMSALSLGCVRTF